MLQPIKSHTQKPIKTSKTSPVIRKNKDDSNLGRVKKTNVEYRSMKIVKATMPGTLFRRSDAAADMVLIRYSAETKAVSEMPKIISIHLV